MDRLGEVSQNAMSILPQIDALDTKINPTSSQVIQAVTFLSPESWRSLNHPKNVT